MMYDLQELTQNVTIEFKMILMKFDIKFFGRHRKTTCASIEICKLNV